MLEVKQAEIEALKGVDVRLGTLPSKVFKKLEHVNAQIEAKLEIVHKNYKKEILKLSDGFLKEITQLKQDKQNALDAVVKFEKESIAKHKIEIDQMNLQIDNYKAAFNKKSAESLEFQQRMRDLSD